MRNDLRPKLGDYFQSSREKGKAGLPLMSVTLHDGLVFRESLERKTDTNLDPQQHLIVKSDYIAYNMMRVWQGALGRATAEGLVSPAYVVLKPNEKIDSLFAEYLFKTPRMIYLFWAYSYGLTKDRLRLYYNDFARIPVDVPPLPEQKKIAQILSIWDKAITNTEKLLANSQQQKKALMQQLLTGKKRLLDKNGVRFSEEWLSAPLDDLVSKVFGGGTPSRSNPEFWSGEIPWVTVKDLISIRISGSKEHITQAGLKQSSANMVKAGTIIIATRMAIGKVVVADCDVAINQDLKAISASTKVSSEFLFVWFLSQASKIEKMGTGSTVKGVQINAIKSLVLDAPAQAEEQAAITSAIYTAETECERIEAKIGSLKQEKKALMQQLLTGKRRVKVDEAA